jgi:thiopeptide-type bacteriocin biosynthesis protein
VTASISAVSASAIEAGDFELYLHSGTGPSGARLLGRFCYTDPALEHAVRMHLRQEESHHPDTIYAEIVYLPEGRIGNVLCRPVVRDYEIPYMARSGASDVMCIPIQDLVVSVKDGTIVLYSERLQRRVLPRLTNAHGFINPQLPSVYRFLCYLQHQHGQSGPGFSWGRLESLDFLPRIRAGRLVLALARWRISEGEIHSVAELERSESFFQIQQLRRRRGLPRWVVLQESDKSLPVDLENALSVDALVHVLKRGSQATLTEMFPPPNRLCVSSVDGHFYHELNVPFVRKSRSEREAEDRTDPNLNTEGARIEVNLARERRTFPPGSEWLYVKLYGGPVSLDDILLRAVLPLVRGACQSGSVTGWFFIRYCDPQQHLRIRLRGAPERLHRQVLPLVFESFNPYLTSGKLWKIEFATYEREIERYGGLEGLIVSENVFFADSEAVLDILKESESQGDDSIRWRMALLGIDRLLCDCGLDDSEKIEAVDSWQASFHREFRVDNILKRQLSERFRTERGNFELLFDSHSLDEKWKMSKQALDQRSRQMTQAIRKLRELAAEGKLTVNIIHLAQSFAHMHVNRLIRSAQRSHELILYDFLVRIYRMRMARSIKVVSN